jgi:isocitrate dehydrogenase
MTARHPVLRGLQSPCSPVARVETPSPKLPIKRPKTLKQLVGVYIFLDWDQPGLNADELALELHRAAAHTGLKLKIITHRGVKVWPAGMPATFCTDHWRCRFLPTSRSEPGRVGRAIPDQVVALLAAIARAGLQFIKTEQLYTFDGQPGYSVGQGE